MREPADHPARHTRRTFAPLRATLERLLDSFALVDGLPARRAESPQDEE